MRIRLFAEIEIDEQVVTQQWREHNLGKDLPPQMLQVEVPSSAANFTAVALGQVPGVKEVKVQILPLAMTRDLLI